MRGKDSHSLPHLQSEAGCKIAQFALESLTLVSVEKD